MDGLEQTKMTNAKNRLVSECGNEKGNLVIEVDDSKIDNWVILPAVMKTTKLLYQQRKLYRLSQFYGVGQFILNAMLFQRICAQVLACNH